MRFGVRLSEGARIFESLAKRTRERPDSSNVHDLRVVTRVLRAEFWLIPPKRVTDPIRVARRDLKELAKILGEQRKFDVALEDARRFGRKTGDIRKNLKISRRGVLKALRREKRKGYARHLRKAIEEIDRISPSVFSPRIDGLARRLGRAMHSPPKSPTARHHLRIEVKKARYLLKAFDRDVPELAKLQDDLGRWHDLMELSGLSGHPKDLVDAYKKEWGLVERILKPVLMQTTRELADLAEKLRS